MLLHEHENNLASYRMPLCFGFLLFCSFLSHRVRSKLKSRRAMLSDVR